jgi:hypothetical protein
MASADVMAITKWSISVAEKSPARARLLTHFSTLRIYVRPARSIFSNALNFCRSAIASLVRSP